MEIHLAMSVSKYRAGSSPTCAEDQADVQISFEAGEL
jgi:hypothetical protein